MLRRIHPILVCSPLLLGLAALGATVGCKAEPSRLTVTIAPNQIPADGSSTARVTVNLEGYEGAILLSTSRGTFQDSGAERTVVMAVGGQVTVPLVACDGSTDPNCAGNASIVAQADLEIGYGIATIGSGGAASDGGGGGTDGGEVYEGPRECNFFDTKEIVLQVTTNIDCTQGQFTRRCMAAIALPWNGTICPFVGQDDSAMDLSRGQVSPATSRFWRPVKGGGVEGIYRFAPDPVANTDFNTASPYLNDRKMAAPADCGGSTADDEIGFETSSAMAFTYTCGISSYRTTNNGRTWDALPLGLPSNAFTLDTVDHRIAYLQSGGMGTHSVLLKDLRDDSIITSDLELTISSFNPDFYAARATKGGFLLLVGNPRQVVRLLTSGRVEVVGDIASSSGGGSVYLRAISVGGVYYEVRGSNLTREVQRYLPDGSPPTKVLDREEVDQTVPVYPTWVDGIY